MERFFSQACEQLKVRHETTLKATDALCRWLERHVSAWQGSSARPTPSSSARTFDRLIDKTLDTIGGPHADDVSLAMALRSAGLTLDQVDPFVALFLAHIQAQAFEGYVGTTRRLGDWLDRGATPLGPMGRDYVALWN